MEKKAKKGEKGDNTQEKILNAARELFVEHGFTGVSMGKIAAKANVNHSLLFHHFKNKLNLWTEVKMAIIKQGASVSSILPDLNQSFEEFTRQLLTRAINYYKDNPDLIRMTNWQRLDSSEKQTVGIGMTAEMKNWIAACKAFQKTGEIHSKIKPEFVITFLMSIVSSAALDPNAFITEPKDLAEYIEFCTQRVVQGFK